MRNGKSSTTASFVATMRGLAAYERAPLVTDAYAERLVDGPFRLGLAVARRAPRMTGLAMRAAAILSGGKTRHLELRTRAIDDVLAEEAHAGASQLVILGAGLDARAWRLPSLEHATVFEVDHPATQRQKRARLDAEEGARVHYVAVDFERDRLNEALPRAGYDVASRATFLWEGVTMYLTEDAVRATLAAVASLAAKDSVIALTYHAPGLRFEGALARVAVRAIGEPFRLTMPPEPQKSR
ncbi:class I SAM-dependent methyltransferase [soil metagenome]